LPSLKRRGLDVEVFVVQAKESLATANKTLDIIRPFMANISSIDLLDRIFEAATIGVENAEQLCKIGTLQPNERKEAARKYVLDSVKLVGVTITPEVERLIDGAIEANVFEINPP
jgi:hypothetical protein